MAADPTNLRCKTACRYLFAGLLVVLVAVSSSASSVRAQDTLRIAAVVNDDIISVFDLQSRTMLVTILSKLPRNQQTLQRLAPQVLRLLIDEKLKQQEARRMGIEVSQSDIEAALATAEEIYNYQPGELIDLLEQTGIDVNTLIEQIESEIAWSRIVPSKHGQNVNVTDDDVNKVLAEEEAHQNQPQYLLSELVLSVDSPANLPATKKQAQQLIQEINNGADFESLARTFSQSPSAQNGGALDWLHIDQLPPDVVPVVRSISPGQISAPISVPGAFIIIKLRGTRTQGSDKPGEVIVDLNQFHLDVPGDSTDETVQSYIAIATEKTADVKSCTGMTEAGQEFGSPLSGQLGKVNMSKLPDHIAAVVDSLEENSPSKPVRTEDSVIVLMVCERTDPNADAEAQKRDRIYMSIYNDRLTVYARQTIRDLRRSAFIDIR